VTVAEALAGCGLEPSEARMLLSQASGLSRAAIAAHPERELPDAAVEGFSAMAARRRSGEPVAYLLGEREFYNLMLAVTPAVLIPRPETELLVDFAREYLPRDGTLLDLGTGSGAIALAVKHERPDARVTAVDKSAPALEVARANAVRHRLDVEFLQGSWFGPLRARRFDVVVSNPPYVSEGDAHLAQGDVRFEPRSALVGGAEGMDDLRSIASEATSHLTRGGWVAIEHGAGQDDAVRKLLQAAGLEAVASRPDLAGIARITTGKYNPE
jgi:release factor glutamine methyltransferase